MTDPGYTVVIASRVDDPLLPEAVASIAAQTLRATAVLVVVNPEDTVSPAWADTVKDAADSVVLEVLRSPEPGMVRALNHGIRASRTPYLAFLDSDDLWLPEKQARQLEALAGGPPLDAVSCRAANFHVAEDGSSVVGAPAPATMFTCTTFRRAAFETYGLLDTSTTHFTWLYRWWGQARELGITSTCLDDVGLHRRLHDKNSWTVERRQAHQDLLREVRAHARRHRA
jgi:glycosyltransferase involved in cell wall biosynthesis